MLVPHQIGRAISYHNFHFLTFIRDLWMTQMLVPHQITYLGTTPWTQITLYGFPNHLISPGHYMEEKHHIIPQTSQWISTISASWDRFSWNLVDVLAIRSKIVYWISRKSVEWLHQSFSLIYIYQTRAERDTTFLFNNISWDFTLIFIDRKKEVCRCLFKP